MFFVGEDVHVDMGALYICWMHITLVDSENMENRHDFLVSLPINKLKEPWLPPGSYAIDPAKPHRKSSNSCALTEGMVPLVGWGGRRLGVVQKKHDDT